MFDLKEKIKNKQELDERINNLKKNPNSYKLRYNHNNSVDYIYGYIDRENKKIHFFGADPVQNLSILVDEGFNLYQVLEPRKETNPFLNITTYMCDYSLYNPKNFIRIAVQNNAEIIKKIDLKDVSNSIVNIIDSSSNQINQSVSVENAFDVFKDELDYSYKLPIGIDILLKIIDKVIAGIDPIEKLEGKMVDFMIKELTKNASIAFKYLIGKIKASRK